MTEFQSIYLILLTISLLIPVGFAVYAWKHRSTPGALAFMWFMLSGAFTALCYLGLAIAPDPTFGYFWARLRFLGMAPLTVSYLLFVLEYTGHDSWLKLRRFSWLLVIPAITQVVIWTNGWHHAFFASWRLEDRGLLSAEISKFGAWYWIYAVYSYLMIIIGFWVLGSRLIRARGVYRRQALLIFLGSLIAGLASLPGTVKLMDPPFNTLPLGVALGSLYLTWALFRYGLLDLTPVAHTTIFRSMNDAAVILDSRDRIVEMNPAALRLFGKTEAEVIGQPVATVFAVSPDLLDTYRAFYEAQDSLTLGEGAEARVYEFQISPLFHRQQLMGRFIVLHDITERKQAEAALRKSEQQYRAVSELSSDYAFSYRVEPDGSLVTEWVTDAAARITGITPEEWASSERFYQCVHPDDADRARRRYKETMAGQSTTIEFRLIKPDGELVWVRSHSRPIWDEQQQRVIRIFGAGQDITAQKNAEDSLRIKDMAIESSISAVALADLDGNLTYVNPALLQLWGWERADEVLGKSTTEFWQDPEQAREVIHALFNEGKWFGELEARRKDGSTFVAQFAANMVRDIHGDPVQMMASFVDITDRKKSEEALRASEARFRLLVDTLPTIVFIHQDGNLVYINPFAEGVSGYSTDEIIRDGFWRILTPEAQAMTREGLQARASGDTSLDPSYEIGIVTRSGETRTLHMSLINMDYDGRPALLGTALDITELKRAEQQRLELMMEKERVQILAHFITRASHEFRTPLSTINTSIYLLQKTDDPAAQRRYVSTIHDRVREITDLVEDMITLTGLDSIQPWLMKPLNLCELVGDIFSARQIGFREKDIHSTLDCHIDGLTVIAEGDYLRQALEHLLDNALQFTPPHGTICVRLETVENHALISVSDTGAGISEGDLPRVFERFYRADKVGTTRGFGLGLPIARTIIERHNGRIEVHSEGMPGKGTTFTVWLPIQESES